MASVKSKMMAVAQDILDTYGTTEVTTIKMNRILKDHGFKNQSDMDAFRDSCTYVSGYTYDVQNVIDGEDPAFTKSASPLALPKIVVPKKKTDPVVKRTPDLSEKVSVDSVLDASSNSLVSQEVQVIKPKMVVHSFRNEDVYIPEKDPLFVAWGNYDRLEKVIASRRFFPVYISGDSGNGKSKMSEQACSKNRRTFIRVQINSETTEDDLIGGFRLIAGETVFVKGPVIKAMETGSVLVLDEIDRGSNLLLCLQGILEGTPFLIKKTGEVVVPVEGFNIIATGNTKGRGDESGRFDASILDDAFLERFRILLEQEYAPITIERKILKAKMVNENVYNEELLDRLCLWIDSLRKTYETGAINACISTRRSCGIIETMAIFDDIDEAIDLATNRFDEITKEALKEVWELTNKKDL